MARGDVLMWDPFEGGERPKYDPVLSTTEAKAPAAATNPKDLVGIRKLPTLSVLPPASILHEAAAMRYGAYEAPKADGSTGYGPFNWRTKRVVMSIYLDAAVRHVLQFVDGEECASDSGVNHLGHAKACLGIILDAIECGNIADDRPPRGKATEILERLKQ